MIVDCPIAQLKTILFLPPVGLYNVKVLLWVCSFLMSLFHESFRNIVQTCSAIVLHWCDRSFLMDSFCVDFHSTDLVVLLFESIRMFVSPDVLFSSSFIFVQFYFLNVYFKLLTCDVKYSPERLSC